MDATTTLSPSRAVVLLQGVGVGTPPTVIYDGNVKTYVPDSFFPDTEAHSDDFGLLELEGEGTSPPPPGFGMLYSDRIDRLATYVARDARVDGWGLGTNAPDTGCGVSFEDLAPRNGHMSIASISGGIVDALLNKGSQICSGDSGAPWSAAFGAKQLTFGVTRGKAAAMTCDGHCYAPGETIPGPLLVPWIDWIVDTARAARHPIRCGTFRATGDDRRSYQYRACVDRCDDR
jgi:hypothetical protein